jgi:uncharacterized protein YabE (DUF348 family)
MEPEDHARLRVALPPARSDEVWSCMFVPRLTEPRARLRTVVSVATGSAVIAGSLLAAATPANAATTTVTLTVDGTTTTVSTSADTVSELLTEREIPFDSSDLVSPSPSTALFGGMAVSWTPATRVVVRDGSARTTHRVVSDTVGEVQNELDLPNGSSSATFTQLQAYSYDDARVYGPAGKALQASDPIREDSVAVIHRIRYAFPDDYKRIDRRVVKERSPLVRQGATRTFKEGRDGRKRVIYRKKFVDGDLVAQRIVRSRVITEQRRKVVRVGTGPNWIGLARCESGGNPNAVNPAGYYGLYQFSISTWRAVGGKGIPTDYGYWEQTKRAWKLYKGSGSSPWPHCGRYL